VVGRGRESLGLAALNVARLAKAGSDGRQFGGALRRSEDAGDRRVLHIVSMYLGSPLGTALCPLQARLEESAICGLDLRGRRDLHSA
jgi:hypothetical protein